MNNIFFIFFSKCVFCIEKSCIFAASNTRSLNNALVVELVDTQDLKSCDHRGRAGSSPARGTKKKSGSSSVGRA